MADAQATPEPIALQPLVSAPADLRAAYRERRSEEQTKVIHIADEDEFVAKGWRVERRTKRSAKLQRAKTPATLLEDRMWCLLHNLGYSVMNGANFKIQFKRQDGTVGRKQIDVFAKDAETVVVVECKCKDVRGKRSLQKDIHETQNLQKPFANAIRKHFTESDGQAYKPKILWIYVTENIIWSDNDIERADDANIQIITENELQYFEAYVEHVGTAGRYQFLAEFFAGQKIPGLSGMKVPATRGYFGADKFYSFTISARHLLKIAFVNHQALNHPDSRPAYQRMISKPRLKAIGKFIEDGGFFPTNVLVNFNQKCNFDLLAPETSGEGTRLGLLHLPDEYKSAWIIDGQHRLFGFTNLPDRFLDRVLNVIAFEELPAVKEADLFITINHEQKSVPKSLLVALQADLKLGSNDPKESLSALGSALVRALANDHSSPLYRRFAIPGVPEAVGQNLTLPEVVKGLVTSTLIGRVIGKKTRAPGYLSGGTDDETLQRSRKVLNAYFAAIMDSNPARWNAGKSGHVSVNPGIRAHLRLLQELLQYQGAKGSIDPQVDSADELAKLLPGFLDPLTTWLGKASDDDVAARFARKFGEGGVTDYYYGLCEIMSKKHPGFGGVEFANYRARKDDQRASDADADVNDLQMVISKVVIDALKDLYGIKELESGEKAYWELGIENSDIKQAAYKSQQQNPAAKRAPKEAYLNLIDFEKIIKQKGNWERLSPIFNIPAKGVRADSKKYHLEWLTELNEIRRIAAHKSVYRQYKDDDYAFIAWLKKEIYDRCAAAGIDLQ